MTIHNAISSQNIIFNEVFYVGIEFYNSFYFGIFVCIISPSIICSYAFTFCGEDLYIYYAIYTFVYNRVKTQIYAFIDINKYMIRVEFCVGISYVLILHKCQHVIGTFIRYVTKADDMVFFYKINISYYLSTLSSPVHIPSVYTCTHNYLIRNFFWNIE